MSRKEETLQFYYRSPRPWHGMTVSTWFRLLRSNRFRVSLGRMPMASVISLLSFGNSALSAFEQLRHHRRISEAKIHTPPLFVVGHWRCGTTLLHELLNLDQRHAGPTGCEVMAPHCFLTFSWFIRRVVPLFHPSHRPMDDMPFGMDRPQEDEFALMLLGLQSPYVMFAWPNGPLDGRHYLDLSKRSRAEREQWMNTFHMFLRKMTLVTGDRRLVLKSPTHTARIATLLEMFPDAKFVHIVRDPHLTIPSALKMMRRIQYMFGLQQPHFANLEENVFDTVQEMYHAFWRDSNEIPTGQLAELRFEDLVSSPVATMRDVYEQLDLGGFDEVEPLLEAYQKQNEGYRQNRYDNTGELSNRIDQACGEYIQKYGYSSPRANRADASVE